MSKIKNLICPILFYIKIIPKIFEIGKYLKRRKKIHFCDFWNLEVEIFFFPILGISKFLKLRKFKNCKNFQNSKIARIKKN